MQSPQTCSLGSYVHHRQGMYVCMYVWSRPPPTLPTYPLTYLPTYPPHLPTYLQKLQPSLAYLDEVRKHLARLPSLDTDTRTLLVTGYPNVGKSSFMNKVGRYVGR